MSNHKSDRCDDCSSNSAWTRRDFLGATAAAVGAASLGWSPASALAAPKTDSPAEIAVAEFFKTLTDAQKKEMHLSWDDPRRTKINANWTITKAHYSTFAKPQQELILRILKGITSEDGYERFQAQMKSDHGGIDNYAVAIFGTPGEAKCSFALTGRHLTLRADGDTTEKVAFGGPLVYGHGATGNTDKNLFWYQTKRANELFQALSPDQRKSALVARSPKESAVEFRPEDAELPGLSGGQLSSDQQTLLKSVLSDVLKPYRTEDVEEVMSIVEAGGGAAKMHMAFYQAGDLGDDGVWDVWRLESPNLICHFRGSPHVHAYLNVSRRG